MDMTYATLAETVKARRSWRSTGAAFDTNVRRSAALALMEMSSLIEGSLAEDMFHTRTLRTYRGTDVGVSSTVAATSDRLVLEILSNTGAPLTPGEWHPQVDGTWDAIMWLEIQVSISNPDGSTYTEYERRQSLEWWSEEVSSITRYYVTIDRPWRNTSDTLLAYRLYQPHFYMPSVYTGLKHPSAGKIWNPGLYYMNEISYADADQLRLLASPYDVTGPVQMIWKDRYYTEQAFHTAPTVAVAYEGLLPVPWAGPVQEGVFTFYATVVWGRTSLEYQDANNLIRDPIFESAPSPVSASFSHVANAGLAVRITVPNPDEIRGFSVAGTLRYGHSGRRVRIYAARSSIRTAGLGTYNNVEADNIPYLIAEIDPYDQTPTSTYTWDGSAFPEVTRRLPFHNTTQVGYRMYPMPDYEYILDARVKCAPAELAGPGDVVPVHELGMPMFLRLFESELCRFDGGDLATSTALRQEALAMAGRIRGQLAGLQVIMPASYSIGRNKRAPFANFPINATRGIT